MSRITMTQRGQCLRNRSRMMSKVVDHFYPALFAAQLLPPRDPGKSFQRIVDLCLRHIVKSRGRRGHGSVAHIELADERDLKGVFAEFKARALGGIGNVANSLRAI